jgi:hypothetical protein
MPHPKAETSASTGGAGTLIAVGRHVDLVKILVR